MRTQCDCQFNDFGLYLGLFVLLTTSGVVVFDSRSQIIADILIILLKTFDSFSDNFVALIGSTWFI